jgi:Cu-Zn family superoxide dismutase
MVAAGAMPAMAGAAIFSRAALSDLSAAADPTDGAWAVASATVAEGMTVVVLNVKGLDADQAGRTLGAHVHIGPCVAGAGAAALGHYNSLAGGISPDTEVWLDFTIGAGGTGHAEAVVPFEIEAGTAHSIVIHRDPTAAGTGVAGPRLACIPLEF